MKILVVEDNKPIADRITEFLQESDFDVVVENSSASLKRRIQQDHGIEMVVLDLLLGRQESVEGGLENIETIRVHRPFVPILVFTEHAQKEWISQVKNVGASDLLRKPPRITHDYFESVFLPKIGEILQRHDAFDFEGMQNRIRTLKENALIKRVIIPLFRHMGFNEVTPVQHHGPTEHGMDILPFYKVDELSSRSYYAAQVKAGDIHARSGTKGHVRTVIDQAKSALEKRFLDADNLRRKVDKVFLICSGKISPDARAILNDWLEGNGRVSLIDGDRLVNLLFKHQLVHLLGSGRHQPAVDVIPCRLDTYAKKVASWEHLLRFVVCDALGVESSQAGEIYGAILERERQFPTVIGEGYALPHIYDIHLDRHKVVLCACREAHDWAVLEPRRVRYAVLCAFAGEGKETVTIRRLVTAVVGESMTDQSHSPMNEITWLHKIQTSLADALSQKDFEVHSLAIRKLNIGRRLQASLRKKWVGAICRDAGSK
jgi:CheY-like chemotaxis protein